MSFNVCTLVWRTRCSLFKGDIKGFIRFCRGKTFNLCIMNWMEYGRFCALLPPLFLQLPRTNASHYFLTSRLTYILPALLQIKGSPWKPEFTLAADFVSSWIFHAQAINAILGILAHIRSLKLKIKV